MTSHFGMRREREHIADRIAQIRFRHHSLLPSAASLVARPSDEAARDGLYCITDVHCMAPTPTAKE